MQKRTPALLGVLALLALVLPTALPAASYLFPTQVPGGAYQDYPNGVLGTRFQSDTPGRITALRYYAQAGDNDETTLTLWDAASQTELASVTGTPSGTAGWFEVPLTTPVAIEPGEDYVVSYTAGANGYYAVTSQFFDTALVSGPLTAPIGAGVFADSGFPSQTFGNTSYFADVAFEPNAISHLFSAQVPDSPLQDYPNGVLGTRFRSDHPGRITALRYYAQNGDNDATTLRLWNAATQAEIASVSGTPSGTAGWFELALPTPVEITSGSEYVVSYDAGANGNYVASSHFFDTALTNGPLTAPIGAGVFADSGFPTQSFNNAAYFADVVLETQASFPTMVVEGNGTTIGGGDATPDRADGTQFGGADMNTGTADRTFTIRNTGSASLVLSGSPLVEITGPQAGDFSVTGQPAAQVAPGGSTSFTVRFQPSTSGPRDASIVIQNNAGGAYQFNVQGIGVGSGYRVVGNKSEGSQTVIIDYQTLTGNRFTAWRDLRISQINVKVASLASSTIPEARLKCAIYVDQGGTSGRLLGSTEDVVNPTTNGWFALDLTTPVNVGVGSNYWLVVLADADEISLYADPALPGAAATRGEQFAQIYNSPWPETIDLPTAVPGNVTLCIYAEGMPVGSTGPEMEVQGGGQWIASGTTNAVVANGTDLGSAMLYGGSRESTFTILNVGQASLSLTGAPIVSVSGPHAADFSVTTQPAASVAAGGSTTFTVRFSPSGAGLRTANLSIPASAPTGVYQFAIQGAGMHPPGSAVIGNDGIGTDSRTIGNNQIHGNRFIAPGDMRITELRASVVGLLDGSFTTAVYADNNGRPDRLLRSSQLVTSPTNGWNTFPLTEALDLTGGRAYWFALWSDSPGAVLPGDNFGTTYMGTYSYANLGGVWPDPISLPTPNAETRTYLIYAEGTPLTAAPGPQADVRGNGKLIISGDTTPTTLDGTDFGSLPQGMGTVEHTFTIQNPGANPLQLSADDPVAITGAAARDFEVLSQPASTIPAGGSGTFTVRFSPSVKGVRAATLVIANNDINPEKNPYQFTVRGAGLPVARESLWPDSTVGADVGNDGTYYELGTIFQASVPGEVTQIRVFSVGGDDGEHTVWLWRTADQAVVGGPYIWNFGGVTGWIYLDIPPVAIEPATDYTVSISTGTGPMRNYANIPGVVASGGSNGQHLSYPANAGVFIDNQPGAMPTQSYNGSTYLRDIVFVPATNTIGFPRMAVIGNANLIPDGYSSPVATNYTDFGLGSAGAGAVERTFVITNSGNAPLKLVGTPLVEVQGANAGEFSVVAEPADTIPAGGTASFTIRFSPAAVGARRAVMAIQNDDKNPYYFTVSGTGDQVVPITFRVTSITTDIAAGNVTIQWEGPDQQFQVERATSASGPFAPLGAPQSAKSYTDVGALQNNAQLFYRVRY